jgi:adenosine deaminase
MNEDQLAQIHALPKVELHLHLEGGAPPDFIRRLAKEKSVDVSRVFNRDGGYAYKDFWHFLSVYEAATQVLTSPDDFARLVLAVLEQSAANGVIYTETFVSPDFCGGRDLGAWREYLSAMQEASDQAERDFGVTLRGIATCIRHFGPDKARETARCAAETCGDWLVGFGMAGDEKMGHAKDFSYAFDMAREAGLRLTSHAGEWGGAASVAETLRDLRPERIGHGVMAIDDLALVDKMAEEGTVLEVCPGSNVWLGVVPSWDTHPIQKLRDRGVKVTVSTDDPPFFHTTMDREYEMLARTFGWDISTLRDVTMTAAKSAFCSPNDREKLLKRLETK